MMDCSCINGNMIGCGGRLCNACRPLLKKFRLFRYPYDNSGAPRTDQMPQEYALCGFTASIGGANAKGRLEIPGLTAGTDRGLRLTVIGHTCEEVLKGDRVDIGGETYRVAVVQRGIPAVAVLVPSKSGGRVN